MLKQLTRLLGEDTAIDSTLIHPLQPWLKIPRLHHLLPYQSYDEDTQFFYNKASTGFVLLGTPIVGASLDDQGQIANFFAQDKNLAEGTSLQFLMIASPKVGPALDAWASVRLPGLYQDLATRRAQFLKQKASYDPQENIRDFRVIISYTCPGQVTSNIDRQRLEIIRRELQATLRKVGMHTDALGAQGLISELVQIVNYRPGAMPEPTRWNSEESLDKQIFH